MSDMDPGLTGGAAPEKFEYLNGVAEAELLALAQLNIENIITSLDISELDTQLPMVFERYPSLESYRDLVEAIAASYLEAHNKAEEGWRVCVKPWQELPDNSPDQFPYTRIADAEASRALAETIFMCSLPEEGEIEAKKGNFTIQFFADPNVFHYISRTVRPEDDSLVDVYGYSKVVFGIPVILMRRMSDNLSMHSNIGFAHERQHLRTNLLGFALDSLDRTYTRSGLPKPEIIQRWGYVQIDEGTQEGMLWSELLCVMAEARVLDIYLNQKANLVCMSTEEVAGYLYRALTQRLLDKKGPYVRGDSKDFEHTVDIVVAMTKIRRHYAGAIGEIAADRMTGAILAQYPLLQWPQVANEVVALPPMNSIYQPPITFTELVSEVK